MKLKNKMRDFCRVPPHLGDSEMFENSLEAVKRASTRRDTNAREKESK
jgi:hypothetical protein